jgi:hypothetical protein
MMMMPNSGLRGGDDLPQRQETLGLASAYQKEGDTLQVSLLFSHGGKSDYIFCGRCTPGLHTMELYARIDSYKHPGMHSCFAERL